MGSILGPFELLWTNHVYPIRARAYNDLSKDAVLLKTASNHVQALPLKWAHFRGLEMARTDGVTGCIRMSL